MNERIKQLRLALGLNQTQFGSRIGLTHSGVSVIERGKARVVTETRIKLIINEFGVSETWLRTGEGEMFPIKNQAEQLNAKLNTNGDLFLKEVIHRLCNLTPKNLEVAADFILEICEGYKKATAEREKTTPLENSSNDAGKGPGP